MLITLAVLILFFTGVVGEQVPCNIGQTQCSSTNTVSYIGNVLYCCPRDFSIQWRSGVQNGTPQTECICDRQYYESDCYEGQAQCSGASSYSYDGNLVRCCRDGSVMSSAMSNVNGQTSGYCKCRRWATNSPSLINAEQLQYWNQWLSTFQNQLQYQLNSIQNPSLRINGFGQWAVPLFDGIRRGLNSVGGVSNNGANVGGNGNLQSLNSVSTNTQILSTEQMNRNQSQRNTRSFLDMLSPASWFNQSTNTSTNGNQMQANDSVHSPLPLRSTAG